METRPGKITYAETRESVLERWEQQGIIVPGCPGCEHVYGYPGHPYEYVAPRHRSSVNCESGRRPHCTCDVCF